MDDFLETLTHEYYESPEDAASLRVARLFVVSGPLAGTSFELGADPVTIGRRRGNTVQINSSAVSQRHCTITKRPGDHYALKDEGSRNGTLVNDRPVAAGTSHPLTHGDKIRLADTVLFFVDPRPTTPAGGVEEIQIDREAAAKTAADALAELEDFRTRTRRLDET
jgi:pSer/pThr/pTyr-binding forkhead associated (FHA) protein